MISQDDLPKDDDVFYKVREVLSYFQLRVSRFKQENVKYNGNKKS